MASKYFITGGAGFIGVNYVSRLIARGESVTLFDNLSRRGASLNLAWLEKTYPNKFTFIKGDLRDAEALVQAAKDADVIVHLAAQVAVTSSVIDPRHDFEVNALGTLNVLEAARRNKKNPLVIYSSTNKVFGGLEDVTVKEEATRYGCVDLPNGIPESYPLDFHSPYGCSKGAADQYVRDYHRIYDMPTVVLRQSCIYGTHQFGIEDQGWVAWFMIRALLNQNFTIYGDGKQVRDLLNVEDLMDLFDLLVKDKNKCAGQIFNVGGGKENSISVWLEFKPLLEKLFKRELKPKLADWRLGDQKFFIADSSKAKKLLGWTPKISVENGLETLYKWLVANEALFIEAQSA